MPGAQRLLPDRQAALVKRPGLALTALFGVEHRQVFEAEGDMRMLGAQRLLSDRQGALEKRLGLGVAALIVV